MNTTITPMTTDIQAPAPIQNVTPEQVQQQIPISVADEQKIDAQVDNSLKGLMTTDIHGTDFRARITQITTLAQSEIRTSASTSNRLLEKPVRAMNSGGTSKGSPVGNDLLALRRQMDKLSPDNMLGTKKFLGFIPMGNKIQDYFRSYESAKAQIDEIVESLYRGKDEILRDNASIEEERAQIWTQMQTLQKYNVFAKKMDEELVAAIENIRPTDPDRATILEEEVLYGLRQREQDIMTQAVVNTQGYLALGLISKNNVELANAVERTTTVVMSAMRTAILAQQALASQSDVIQQVSVMKGAADSYIEATGNMLKQNANAVADIASSPTIKIETLTKAMDDVKAAMDMTDNYRTKANVSMQETINLLRTQVDRSQSYLDENRKNAIAGADAQPALASINLT